MIMTSRPWRRRAAMVAEVAFKRSIRVLAPLELDIQTMQISKTRWMSSSRASSALGRYRTLWCVHIAPNSAACPAWRSGWKRHDLSVPTAGHRSDQISLSLAASSRMLWRWCSSKNNQISSHSAVKSTAHTITRLWATSARPVRSLYALTAAYSGTRTRAMPLRSWRRSTRSTWI